MDIPDYSEMAKLLVIDERYEVVKRVTGFAVILQGSEKGTGSICTFPNREGRQHLQKARAELCASAPELLEENQRMNACLAGAELTIKDQEVQIAELMRDLSKIKMILQRQVAEKRRMKND